ncbi:biopolymer transporter ExbD [Sulfitobacter sp. HNIBRBA3233]|uniref:ExbD/TolR family protein n=1 Tax=Sulfitobacter marinivivus TaxID=3158558 RepID=UPI0032DFAC9F
MRLVRPDHRPATEPIIALIDVVFFLLVFFMLVARLDASAPFEVAPPLALSGQDMPGGGVTLSVGRDGRLAVDGTAVPGEDWERSVAAAMDRGQATLIRVNAHRDTPLRHILPLIEALERGGYGEVVLVVTPDAR